MILPGTDMILSGISNQSVSAKYLLRAAWNCPYYIIRATAQAFVVDGVCPPPRYMTLCCWPLPAANCIPTVNSEWRAQVGMGSGNCCGIRALDREQGWGSGSHSIEVHNAM